MATALVGRRIAQLVLNRLAFGPRPESIDAVIERGIERWIEDQLAPAPDGPLEARLRAFPTLSYSIGENIRRYDADPRSLALHLQELSAAHFVRAVHGRNQLEEVLVDFWFNHFNVYAPDNLVRFGVARYEQDAIRPRVLGRFRDLLGAVAGSWAMMVYLDNYLSTARSINENYARELMELHTLGVDGGYTQRDVEEIARAFTGWGIDRAGAFLYRNQAHDQGAKTVLGQRLPAGQGQKDGEDVLDLLARHPATARFISLKLARRFVSDNPPESVVARGAEAFTRSGGEIREVLRALVGTPEFFGESFGAGKLKTPHEYVMSALRAVGADLTDARRLVGRDNSLGAMGMPKYEALDPTGWSDRGSDWLPNPGSHLARLNFTLGLLSQEQPGVDVDIRALVGDADAGDAGAVTRALDERLFGGTLPPEVRAAAAKAGASGAVQPALKAVALALASPAFQVR
jgi:uncharacterized protein (DUF1800 family)